MWSSVLGPSCILLTLDRILVLSRPLASQAIKEKQTLEKSDQTRPQCQRAQREPCPLGVTLQAVHIFLMVSGNKQTQSCLFPG